MGYQYTRDWVTGSSFESHTYACHCCLKNHYLCPLLEELQMQGCLIYNSENIGTYFRKKSRTLSNVKKKRISISLCIKDCCEKKNLKNNYWARNFRGKDRNATGYPGNATVALAPCAKEKIIFSPWEVCNNFYPNVWGVAVRLGAEVRSYNLRLFLSFRNYNVFAKINSKNLL